MNTNYEDEFTAKYVAALTQTGIGNYANNGAEYHSLLSAYYSLMECINSKSNVGNIVTAKQKFVNSLNQVQCNVSKAWKVRFPNDKFPPQTSIHGINLLILKILG